MPKLLVNVSSNSLRASTFIVELDYDWKKAGEYKNITTIEVVETGNNASNGSIARLSAHSGTVPDCCARFARVPR